MNRAKITEEYKTALRENRWKTFYRDCAAVQPGSLQEVLLHETAAAWIKPGKMRGGWKERASESQACCK